MPYTPKNVGITQAAPRAPKVRVNMNKGVSAVARDLGITPTAVSLALRKGRTITELYATHAMVDAERAKVLGGKARGSPGTAAHNASLHADTSHRPTEEQKSAAIKEQESRVAAEIRKIVAQADERELIVAQRRGALVSVAQINEFYGTVFKRMVDVLWRIAPERQDALAACDDPAECGKMLRDAIRAALEKLKLLASGLSGSDIDTEILGVSIDDEGEPADDPVKKPVKSMKSREKSVKVRKNGGKQGKS